MLSRACRLFVAVVLLFGLIGCAVVESTKTVTRESMKSLKPRSGGYRDGTETTDDEWADLGESARAARSKETSDDPLRKWMLSPKAISIERNLGIE